MAQNLPGRHRAPGRFNPISELTLLAKETAQPAVKGAAIVAASGGLIATFASPASAAPSVDARIAPAVAPAAGPAVVGSGTATLKTTNTLSLIGFAAPAKAKAVKPIVVEDFVVKAQRAKAAADAKAKAAAAKAKAAAAKRAADRAAAERRAAAQRQAAAAQRPAAAAQRPAAAPASRTVARSTTTARASRSTTRAAIAPAPTPKKVVTPKKKAFAPAPSASGIVGIAQSLGGVPYVWGGTTTRGFDCSGFTSYVYRQAGISIPRTAGAQKRASTPVSSPRPGDLVFFGSPVYHVGIYVSPGRMIDAQRPGTTTGNHSIWTTPSGYGRV